MTKLRLTILCMIGLISVASAQVYLTKDQALKMYLGDDIQRKTVFLTDENIEEIQQKARAKVESKIVTFYASEKGFAFFETRTIRTMPATFIVVVNPKGSVEAVEMMAFYEPEDYLPPKRWLKTFGGKSTNDDLWLKRGIYNISGATLSAQAIAESVRRILATFELAIHKEQQ